MQRPDLQAIANEWINALDIRDRSISVTYAPNLINPANGDIVYGLMTILDRPAKRFRIDIQDPSTWPAGAPLPPTLRTITRAIRHECIHIRVNDFTPDDPTDADIQAEEEAVWAIEGAFDRITNAAQPRIAAMVAKQLDRKTQTLAQVAGQIRAMTATAATRQTKGRSMAMEPETAKMLLDASESEDAAAMKLAIRKIVEDALTGGEAAPPSVPESSTLPMGAENELLMADKPPMTMDDKAGLVRSMRAELVDIRAMRTTVAKDAADVKAAVAILRPQAKLEIVRSMRADGITLTKAAEDMITNAPTVQAAESLAVAMRAMAPAGARRGASLPPANDGAGLTRAQAAAHAKMTNSGNPGADTYRAECIKANDASKGAK